MSSKCRKFDFFDYFLCTFLSALKEKYEKNAAQGKESLERKKADCCFFLGKISSLYAAFLWFSTAGGRKVT